MRVRWIAFSWIAVLGLAVSGFAQSALVLQGGVGQTVTFSGQGAGTSGIGVSLGSCDANACVLYGMASGSGTLGSVGYFMLASTANSISLAANGSNTYAVQSTAPILFPYFGISTANGETGLLLAGNLNLVNFGQSPGSSQGTFGTNLSANLTVTGGALAGALASSNLPLRLNVDFPGSASLSSLVGTGNSFTAILSSGSAASVSPTPEPAALLLMVLGALVLGACLLRRRQLGVPLVGA